MSTLELSSSSNNLCPREQKVLAEMISGLLKQGFNAKTLGSYGRL